MIDARALGHAIFETPDLEAQIAYYTGVLGLHVEHRDAEARDPGDAARP